MSVNADSPANRLKSYKNKALDSQELRRRREEEGIQLRKQKRDEQVNNISSDGCCPGLLISNTCNEKHKHVCLSGSHEKFNDNFIYNPCKWEYIDSIGGVLVRFWT